MSAFYTPTLDELKAAWVRVRRSWDEVSPEEAANEFDRTMDEFGNEQYEDGYSEGYAYGNLEYYPGEPIDGPRSM